jgi:hypothetical protein
MVLLASHVAIGVNEFLGHLYLELLGESLHVGNGENPLVADPQTWFRHLAGGQKVNDLVGLATQDISDLPQKKILCIIHAGIYAADSFFRDEK